MSDNVKHPNHYCKAGIECIDAIKSAISTITDPFEAYCTGNIIKYIWRWNDKNGIEDLHKAIQYIDFIEQYRASKTILPLSAPNRPTQAEYEEFFEGEEDVTESEPKGKYEGICSQQLSDMVCDGSDLSPFRCEYGKCPLVVKVNGKTLTCTPFMEQYPEAFRRVAIDYLEGLEGKA